MSEPVRHGFIRAMMLSLAVHAVLLLSVVGELPARPAVPPARISAVLAGREEVKSEPLLVPEPPVSPAKSRPLVTPDLASRSFPAQESTALADPAPSSSPVPAERSAGSPVPTVDEGASEPSREGVSADELRQYRLSLAIAARRFKRYPALARERAWEGTVEVLIVVSALLPAPEISLARSSGHAALDEQALDMIGQAARATALPGNLQGRSFRLLLPVRFSLEGGQ